jgi:hypothetical protein
MKLPYTLKVTYPIATVMMKIHSPAVAMRAPRSMVLAVCDTTLRRIRSAVCALPCNGPPQQADREGAVSKKEAEGRKKEEKSRWRSLPYTTESAVTDRR